MLPSVPSFSVFSSPDSPHLQLPPHGDAGDFTFPENPILTLLEEEVRLAEDEEPPPPMYMARGLGIDRRDADAESGCDPERSLAEFPNDPALLRNHARLLASRGDVHEAEDYYHRATLADPEDGETLMQYAKLVWELHHDQQRALTYFKLAAEASPNNSDVLAALASFLWEVEDDDETELEDRNQGGEYDREASYAEVPSSRIGTEHSSYRFTGDTSIDGEGEEYLLNMIKESPSNPTLLRSYAHFLHQSKQDLHEAMEYYSLAAQANPGDGESLAMCAKLVWQLHGDHDKASQLFERAINAAPEDCHVLAAHASFLWDTEVNED